MARRWKSAAIAIAVLTAAAQAPVAAASVPIPRMPPGFHWGVSTAGFQAEGSPPDSNWRRYVDGRADSVKDPYANAVDFRHRYAEDIALAKSMGVTTFRMSVEWPRIEPRPGALDQDALAYYDDVVREIKAAGMTPMITLTHFTHPGWIADRGGWTNPGTVESWLAFTDLVVRRYAGLGVLWVTFNEPTVYRTFEERNGKLGVFQSGAMMDNLVAAHRRGYDLIHRLDPGAMVTSNLAVKPPPLQWFDDSSFVDKVRGKLDFVGIDYYYGASLDNLSVIHAAKDEFWKVAPQPDGIYYALRTYQRKFPGLPLYVVENGMPSDDGKPRADGYTRSDHLRDHLYWVQRALADGVRVIGYNYWSITDNYEWGSYRSRFGLYTVDALTDPALTRRPTDAVATYRAAIAANGVPGGYLPKRRPAWCAFADLRTCFGRLP
ncbi:glycoside hydrolase family 1 protein [Amycolatopsis sp. CA-230715]|uniref:glycoside hydrolase family 1 protein n=1 Tax=Amycolatopsis sp. CA-230715 TaxID=2745196 RepID=UPI001C32979C|nr:family 1 glycosylhydrolase [Amycolatopsis sp. CA-230715]QWF81235.1 Beta-glucosidase [Amycolatopsis sp. CA-230715]